MTAGATQAAPVSPAAPRAPKAPKAPAARSPKAPKTATGGLETAETPPVAQQEPEATYVVVRPFADFVAGQRVNTAEWRPRNVQALVNIGKLSPI